jgi:hypothetical protein
MDPSSINQIVERLGQANNVLVTVSANPSVDQLAGAIGASLMLNKMGKHATAVFSGKVPPTLKFLKPEETLEKNTDSLQDFIIALDKNKADKLRYKVEDDFVRIFITPYRTPITEKDLQFSHGDFNVDVVLALGVHKQQELDEAITAHGRILHDATVISVNTSGSHSELGSINWLEPEASSLCEMLVSLGQALKDDIFDAQMATALLTGIVAETDRFSNERTTSRTMNLASRLLSAGANQQLVADKLEEKPKPDKKDEPKDQEGPEEEPDEKPENTPEEPPEDNDNGTLQINHPEEDDQAPADSLPAVQPPEEEEPEGPVSKVLIDETGNLSLAQELPESQDEPLLPAHTATHDEPPASPSFTATGVPEPLEPSSDALSPATSAPQTILSHDQPQVENNPPAEQTLSDLETAVHTPEPEQVTPPTFDNPADHLDSARDAVEQATAGAPDPLEPIAALNAQPLGAPLHENVPPTIQPDLAAAAVVPPVSSPASFNPPSAGPLEPLTPTYAEPSAPTLEPYGPAPVAPTPPLEPMPPSQPTPPVPNLEPYSPTPPQPSFGGSQPSTQPGAGQQIVNSTSPPPPVPPPMMPPFGTPPAP